MKHFLSAALVCGLSLILSLTGCGKPEEAEPPVLPDYPVEVAGVQLAERPERVIALTPSMEATLEQLGMAGRMVGVSDYGEEPFQWEGEEYNYQHCGGPMSPDILSIRRTEGDLLFTTAPLAEEHLTRLQQMDIAVIVIPHASSLEELRENYTDIFRAMWGETTGRAKAGEFLARFDARLRDIADRSAEGKCAGMEAAYVGPTLLNIATGDTLEGELLELLALENSGAAYTGFSYPKEKEIELEPEILFSNGLLSRDAILGSTCYRSTAAGKNGQFLEVGAFAMESQAPEDLLQVLWKMGSWLDPDAFYVEPYDPGY